MFTRILVPIDGSPFSEGAIPLAQRIARRTGAELHLVQVHVARTELGYPGGLAAYLSPEWDDRVRVREEEHLREIGDRVAAEAGVRTRGALLDGVVVERLIEYARELSIDLVVMTTHGRGGVARVVLGSVAHALIRGCSLPVLAIRPEAVTGAGEASDIGDIDRILLPLDGSDVSARALDPAVTLATAMDAKCTLLRVVSPLYMMRASDSPSMCIDMEGIENERSEARTYLEVAARALRARGIDTDVEVVTHEAAAEAVLNLARQVGARMIVMATNGRTGWRRVALGSVADNVLRSAKVPVLLYRPAPALMQRAPDTTLPAPVPGRVSTRPAWP